MNPNYNCTQGELYAVSRNGWQSCSAKLAAFAAFKPKYTALFITAKINAITAAEALPDEEQRKAVISLLREQLSKKAEQCRDKWQTLRLYIEEAFPENEVPIQLKAAGSAHYEKAGKENWPSVKQLMLDGESFITANEAALSANNNMPTGVGGFPESFTALKGEFDALYNNFVNSTVYSEVGTGDKIAANNAVYKDLISMLKDGQRIYKDDENIKQLFIFEQILGDITSSQSGIKGTVTDSNGNPIEGVTAKLIGPNIETQTDEEGKYSYTIAAKTYSMRFTKAGFQDQQINDIELEPGVTKTVDVVMIAV